MLSRWQPPKAASAPEEDGVGVGKFSTTYFYIKRVPPFCHVKGTKEASVVEMLSNFMVESFASTRVLLCQPDAKECAPRGSSHNSTPHCTQTMPDDDEVEAISLSWAIGKYVQVHTTVAFLLFGNYLHRGSPYKQREAFEFPYHNSFRFLLARSILLAVPIATNSKNQWNSLSVPIDGDILLPSLPLKPPASYGGSACLW